MRLKYKLTCRHRQHAVKVCAMPLVDDKSSDCSRPEPSLFNCIAGGDVDTVVVSVILKCEVCAWGGTKSRLSRVSRSIKECGHVWARRGGKFKRETRLD